jgi:Cu+-exporting ATPase
VRVTDLAGSPFPDVVRTDAARAVVVACSHCGDPCPRAVIGPDGAAFCCLGCQTVFRALHEGGLGDYYRCDVPPGVTQRHADTRDAARFAALDDEAIARRYIEGSDGHLVRATFSIPAMHCASCLWLIERLWRLDPGIVRAEADLMRRTVRVTFRPAAISLRRVAERLAAIGYEPALDTEHDPGHVSAARRRLYLKIGLAGFAFGNVMLFSIPRYLNGGPLEGGFQRLFDTLNIAFAVPVLLYSASDYFTQAWQAVRRRVVSLDVPIAIGLAVLFGRSVADIATGYSEGFMDSFTGLTFFLLIGRLFQQKAFDRIAFDRSYRSFFPLSVRVEHPVTGMTSMLALERLAAGDRILVRPQEIVPADGVLVGEAGAVDYAFVTGEQRPVSVAPGGIVRAGGRAAGNAMRIDLVGEVAHSRLAGLWNNPVFREPKANALAHLSARFGVWFTVVALALAAAGAVAWWPDARMSAQVATAVLIIACPCALTLSAPITLGTAMGMLGRAGFYVKSPAVALALSRIDSIAFDKTGTLTSAAGGLHIEARGLSTRDWRLARRLAAESIHPMSRALAGEGEVAGQVDRCREVPGRGIRGRVDGHDVLIGSAAFAAMELGTVVPAGERRTAVAINGRIRGWVDVQVPARSGIEETARELGRDYQIWLVSGDHDREADRWRAVFGPRLWFRQSPEDKLARIRAEQAAGHRVLMIGDGLNDAGALAAADVGLAVSDETACVVPSCDAVVAGSGLTRLPAVLRYTRAARRVVVLCFVVSIAYNAIGLSLALLGLLTPLATAILMPVSSLTIVGLSTGLMRWKAREVLS